METLNLLKYQVKHIPRFAQIKILLYTFVVLEKDFIIYEKTCFILQMVFKY